MVRIVSLHVGRAQRYETARAAERKPLVWQTAFYKTPVSGRVSVGSLGLAGDEQADRQNHGGLDKAVLAYSADHYDFWATYFGGLKGIALPAPAHAAWSNSSYGAFGENLTVQGLDESSVCIGDRWQAGDVVLEVSQPRQPCWKMGRRWGLPDLPKRVIQNGKTGWYLRVVEEGELEAGMPLQRIARPHGEWTVARAHRLQFHERDEAALRALADLPELSAAWREAVYERLAK